MAHLSYIKHIGNGEIVAIKEDVHWGHVIGFTDPLHYTEVTAANLENIEFKENCLAACLYFETNSWEEYIPKE